MLGSSFDWFTTVLSHFLDEAFALLKARDDWDTFFYSSGAGSGSSSSSSFGSGLSGTAGGGAGGGQARALFKGQRHASLSVAQDAVVYSREDLCELEPLIVSCVLRCVLTYTLSLQAVEHNSLNNVNLQVRY